MANAFVQSKSATTGNTSTTTIAATFTGAVASGSLVCGYVHFGTPVGTEVVSGVADDKSNTYTVVRTVTDAGNFAKAATFYLANITNGPVTVTVTFSANCNFRGITIHEVSGADATPLDKETGNLRSGIGTDADAVTTDAVTTTTDGQYIFSGVSITDDNVALSEFTAGTNFTRREEAGSTSTTNIASEDRIQTSAGSIAATWTHTLTRNNIVTIMTFKAAGAAAAGAAQFMVAASQFSATGGMVGRDIV